MKTSNKILLIAYGVIVLSLTIMIFVSRPLVEKAILGSINQNYHLVK